MKKKKCLQCPHFSQFESLENINWKYGKCNFHNTHKMLNSEICDEMKALEKKNKKKK